MVRHPRLDERQMVGVKRLGKLYSDFQNLGYLRIRIFGMGYCKTGGWPDVFRNVQPWSFWQLLPRCTRGSFPDSWMLETRDMTRRIPHQRMRVMAYRCHPHGPGQRCWQHFPCSSLLQSTQDRLGPVDHPGFKAGQDPSTLLSPIPDSAGVTPQRSTPK
jgi:hypothetical protein